MGAGLNTFLRLKIPMSFPARIDLPLLIFRSYFVRQLLISNWKFKIDAVSRYHFWNLVDVDIGISFNRLQITCCDLLMGEMAAFRINGIG